VVGEYGGVHGIRLRGFRVGVCRRDRLCSLVTGQVSDRRLILVIRRPPRDPGPVMVPGGPAIGGVRPACGPSMPVWAVRREWPFRRRRGPDLEVGARHAGRRRSLCLAAAAAGRKSPGPGDSRLPRWPL